MSLLPDEMTPLLAFLIPAAFFAYGMIVSAIGLIRRRGRLRAEALRRKADPRAPWYRWLDEINRQVEEERPPGAIEKWRE